MSDTLATARERAPSRGETAIIKGAARLFSERGFDGVSMRDIADAAGVSKANIYHHFASKQALYVAVLSARAAETRALLEELSEREVPFAERARRFVSAHLASILEHSQTFRLLLRESLSEDDRQARALADDVVGENFQRLVTILRDGQRAGVIRSDFDPALCATLLVGANVFFFQAQRILSHIPEVTFANDPARYAAGSTDIFLRGLLSPVATDSTGRSK